MYVFIYLLPSGIPVLCNPPTSEQANGILNNLLKQGKERVYLNHGGEVAVDQLMNVDQFILLDCTQPGICVTSTIEGS